MSWTTLLIELANFAVLVWALERLLYRPLRRGIEARRVGVAAREVELDRQREALEERERALLAEEEALTRARQVALREASAAAGAERARILAQAREDARAEQARASALLLAEREEAAARLRELAIDRTIDVAARLAAAIAPERLEAGLREGLLRQLEERSLSGALLPEDAEVVEAELAFAGRAPGPEETDQVRAALSRATGRGVQLATREDPALLAGVALRVDGQVLESSLRAEAAALRERARDLLGQEERASG